MREVEIYLSQGKMESEACEHLEISEKAFYRWRSEYGSMGATQAKKLKEVENENTRLKKLVPDLSLDNALN